MYSYLRKSRFALLFLALCVLLMLAAIQPADTARGNYSEDAAAGGSRHPEAGGIDTGKSHVRGKDNFSVASPPAAEIVKLTASDANANDLFGCSVAVDGDYAIVGAEFDDDGGTSSGSAYIFNRNQGGADNWGQQAKLTASDAAASDWFGSAVSIDGDYAIVGAPWDDDGGIGSGSAYVFHRNEGGPDNWGQVAKLTASDAAAGDHFGYSVSISGDYAIVGAYLDDDGGSASGSAYIFNRNQGGADNWGQVAKLTASDAAASDWFGNSVSISGDYAIVGINPMISGDKCSGSAYLFYRNKGGADNWGQLTKLTASDAAGGDFFGYSVSISGDYAIVGAIYDDDAGDASGSAYLFSGYLDHSIWASAGEGGSISPSGRVHVIGTSNKTFTITPDPGYEIADVIVDKRSVGAVSSYTFHNVSRNHVIKAEFEVIPGSVAVTLKGLRINIPGLQWQVSGSGSWNSLGDTVWLPPGRYTITFLPVPGWLFPDVVIVVPGAGGVSTAALVNVTPEPIPFLVTPCSDYNGDGACDLSLFRPSTGEWLVRDILEKKFGREGDWPVPGDYDGDGIADLAYWRPGKGLWRVRKQFRIKGFGQVGDVPVPADYDGDGLTDAALFRRSTCEWIVRYSSSGKTETTAFAGKGFCVPLPRDYDGDGKAELAVYSLADRTWTIRAFGKGGVDKVVKFGRGGEVPVPADYNCDGLADIAMLNRESGLWRVHGLFKAKVSSKTGDVPVIGDFDCDGSPEFGLFRCVNGVWYLGSKIEFGAKEDIPLARGR